MLKKIIPFLIIIPILFGGCESANKILGGLTSGSGSLTPTNTEIVGGLKQALELGISDGANRLSLADGYLKNNLIKIMFPPEAQKVESTLRSLGLDPMVDRAIESFNRGAERAAKQAAPIFVNAIKSMTVNDAMGILLGADDSATNYLKSSTYQQLQNSYMPIIEKSLNEVNATKYWSDVITRYNQIPLVQKVNPDLTSFVTQKALDGLFFTVVREEQKVRQNVSSRSTDLLRKVFGYADSQKK
jgi:hypothetical protein